MAARPRKSAAMRSTVPAGSPPTRSGIHDHLASGARPRPPGVAAIRRDRLRPERCGRRGNYDHHGQPAHRLYDLDREGRELPPAQSNRDMMRPPDPIASGRRKLNSYVCFVWSVQKNRCL